MYRHTAARSSMCYPRQCFHNIYIQIISDTIKLKKKTKKKKTTIIGADRNRQHITHSREHTTHTVGNGPKCLNELSQRHSPHIIYSERERERKKKEKKEKENIP